MDPAGREFLRKSKTADKTRQSPGTNGDEQLFYEKRKDHSLSAKDFATKLHEPLTQLAFLCRPFWHGGTLMMTALTAILGLWPAALSTRIGAQTQRPLAIVVVGGMRTTLFLTRYLMPVLSSFYGHDQPPEEVSGLAEWRRLCLLLWLGSRLGPLCTGTTLPDSYPKWVRKTFLTETCGFLVIFGPSLSKTFCGPT
jgi:hypothetical protein